MKAHRFRFRAWDKRRCVLASVEVFKWGVDGAEAILSFNGQRWRVSEQNRLTFMQSTGLVDAKGREVFEGDILRSGRKHTLTECYPAPGSPAKVETTYLKYGPVEFGEILDTEFDSISMGYSDLKTVLDGGYEVIGNIWENPGLKGKQCS